MFWSNSSRAIPQGLALITMQEELTEILEGRKVDLVTPKFLNRRIRSRVESEAVIQYTQIGESLSGHPAT
jgi:predicted nucleotidyltransferase